MTLHLVIILLYHEILQDKYEQFIIINNADLYYTMIEY